MAQIKAEQPTTTYSEFKREILGEIGRCIKIPINVLLGDSSNYNYASGRLDHQTFFKSIRNEQVSCEQVVLFSLFEKWYNEAVRIGLLPLIDTKRHSICKYVRFFWDGFEHVDPLKEAKAAESRITGRFSNLSIECAKAGLDWEDVLKQSSLEQQRMKELGLTVTKTTNNEENDGEESEEPDKPSAPVRTRANRRRKSTGSGGE